MKTGGKTVYHIIKFTKGNFVPLKKERHLVGKPAGRSFQNFRQTYLFIFYFFRNTFFVAGYPGFVFIFNFFCHAPLLFFRHQDTRMLRKNKKIKTFVPARHRLRLRRDGRVLVPWWRMFLCCEPGAGLSGFDGLKRFC